MNASTRRLLAVTLFLGVFASYACTPDGHVRGWQTLDLTPHNVSTTIMAPPEAEVKPGKLKSALVSDLTIKGGSDYSIQLFYGPAVTNDIARLKNEHLENVRANRYFRRVVREDAAGFIYESRIDSTATYGFRFVKLQGDQELNFQTGMGALFSLEDVQLMYEAVK